MIKRIAIASPILTASLATCYLGMLMIAGGLHGLFCGAAILRDFRD